MSQGEDEIPKDLTELEYARNILENTLGWPARKSNLELVASCITSISKRKALPAWKAYKYLVRAITLYEEQGGEVDNFWLDRGQYMKVRPKFDRMPLYRRIDDAAKQALERDQSSPEYLALVEQLREMIKNFSRTKGMK